MADRWIETALFGLRKVRNGFGGNDLPERGTLEVRGATVFDNSTDGTTVLQIDTDASSATPNPIPNTIAKRNSSGNCAFVGLQSDTLAVSAGASVGDSILVGDSVVATNTVSGSQVGASTGTFYADPTTLTLAANASGGAVTMLTMVSTTLTAVFNATLTAIGYKVTAAATYTQYIDMLGLAEYSDWEFQNGQRWRALVNTGGSIQFPISRYLPNGSTLLSAAIRIDPPAHGTPPALFPIFQAVKFSAAGGGPALGQVVDPGGGSYDSPHTLIISGMTEVIDKTSFNYALILIPERGANALAGTEVLSVAFTFQMPAGALIQPF